MNNQVDFPPEFDFDVHHMIMYAIRAASSEHVCSHVLRSVAGDKMRTRTVWHHRGEEPSVRPVKQNARGIVEMHRFYQHTVNDSQQHFALFYRPAKASKGVVWCCEHVRTIVGRHFPSDSIFHALQLVPDLYNHEALLILSRVPLIDWKDASAPRSEFDFSELGIKELRGEFVSFMRTQLRRGILGELMMDHTITVDRLNDTGAQWYVLQTLKDGDSFPNVSSMTPQETRFVARYLAHNLRDNVLRRTLRAPWTFSAQLYWDERAGEVVARWHCIDSKKSGIPLEAEVRVSCSSMDHGRPYRKPLLSRSFSSIFETALERIGRGREADNIYMANARSRGRSSRSSIWKLVGGRLCAGEPVEEEGHEADTHETPRPPMEHISNALAQGDLSFLKRAFPRPKEHETATEWTEILELLYDTHGRDMERLRTAVNPSNT